MQPVALGQAKNTIRRAFRELIDPAPKQSKLKKVWEYFSNRCAYCDRLVRKPGDRRLDHLIATSANGSNHLSNLVLSCGPCNDKEKLDTHWERFLRRKVSSDIVFEQRKMKILEWQALHASTAEMVDPKLVDEANNLASQVNDYLMKKASDLRALKEKQHL